MDRTPDIIYIGYPKTASTFIHRCFDAHPDAFVDKRAKRYVHREDVGALSEEEQANLAGKRVYVSLSEKTAESRRMLSGASWRDVSYGREFGSRMDELVLHDPAYFAQRLKERLPEAKIVMCIRDQVDWLISSYRWYIDDLDPKHRTFGDFCETLQGKVLLAAGCYDLTVGAYLEVFGPKQVCVLRFEDLKRDSEAVLAKLYGFAGVEPVPFDTAPANVGRNAATALIHQKAPWLGAVPAPLRALARPAVQRLSRFVRTENLVPEDQRRMLRAFYAASNQRTAKLLAEIDEAQTSEAQTSEAQTGMRQETGLAATG